MILYIVVIALAVIDVVEAAMYARVVNAERRQSARERTLLINQIMHLSGKTWEPPPREEPEEVVEEFDPSRFMTSFSQIEE